MPRVPRKPGSGKRPVNTPARGVAASGDGWGGSPKGAGQAPGNKLAGRPEGVKNGEGKRSVAELMAERHAREKIAERWLAIIDDPSHPMHAAMLDKGAARLDGAPVQPMSGADGGPIVMVRKFFEPVEPPAE